MVLCSSAPVVAPLGLRIDEWARAHTMSPSAARLAAMLGRVTRTRVAPDRVLILHADYDLGSRPSDAVVRADLRGRLGDRKLLDAADVASGLTLGTRTVRRMAADGTLPMRRECGRLTITPGALVEWILARREVPARIGGRSTSWTAAQEARA